MQWGDRWLDERGGPVQLAPPGCGERVGVQLRCAAGHELAVGELEAGRSGEAPGVGRD